MLTLQKNNLISDKSRLAFTLVELLVVIAIIGILSGLIIVGMNNSVQQATIAKAQVFSASLRDSLLANIISQYNFNDISDAKIGTVPATSDIKDSWGSINCSGVYTSGPIIRGGTDCISGKCLQFNGPNATGDPQAGDYITFPNTKYPIGDNPITLEAWIYPKQYQTAGFYGSYWADPTGLLFGGGGYVYFSMYDNTNAYHNYQYDRKKLSLNQWYHVVGTYNSSLVRICLNGDCESWSTLPPRNGPGYQIIAGASDNNYNHYNGLIDDLRLYNTTIPTSQIRENYYIGLSRLLIKGGISKENYQTRLLSFTENISQK